MPVATVTAEFDRLQFIQAAPASPFIPSTANLKQSRGLPQLRLLNPSQYAPFLSANPSPHF